MDWIEKLKKQGIRVEEETVNLDEIFLDPKNANIHPPEQIENLKKSLDTFGQPERLIVSGDGRIIGGNGRYEAMTDLGWETVRITRVFAKESFLDALALTLNKTPEGSYLDDDKVSELLTSISEEDEELILSTGFSDNELTALLDLDDSDLFDVDDIQDDDDFDNIKKPTAASDGYSSFEIVMRHEDKVALVETLNSIRKNEELNGTEITMAEALMILVGTFKQK